jgi:hypothetical protein
MSPTPARNYKCKDEELPVICEYASFSFKRDLADFTAYSPIFDQDYAEAFDQKITSINELVNPKIDTAERKIITARLYATMEGTLDPINRLEGYIKLAKNTIPITAKDFGIKILRDKIHRGDAEGTLRNLRLVAENIDKYRTELNNVGFTAPLATQFTEAIISIDADNDQQYELLSKRKLLVLVNLGQFNDLYTQLNTICNAGKIIYRNTNPEKVKEYTFSYLLSKVRIPSRRQRTRTTNAQTPDSD